MALTIELIPDSEQGGFTARLPDIPAYGEGETEAIEDFKEAIRGYIETFGLEDALSLSLIRPCFNINKCRLQLRLTVSREDAFDCQVES